ncbi:UPF0606 protein KIAA1549-like, partial [Hippocampus zosterae]|uniref:UPF0606 protein KIAA1549-like n=1 Tax=Hippocampus zosterae TaxID=109293 RepID=UPI00223CC826
LLATGEANRPGPPAADSGRGGDGPARDFGAQGIHLLLRPPALLSPSLTPPLPAPLSPWEQSESPEEAWASGDYLETLSFVLPDGEDLATPLPSHAYDGGGRWALSYDGALDGRPTPPLHSRVPFSPSSTAGGGGPDVFPAWDDDYDPEDLTPLRPTELLLPDMNSLEYYTNLLAKEREAGVPRPVVPPASPSPAGASEAPTAGEAKEAPASPGLPPPRPPPTRPARPADAAPRTAVGLTRAPPAPTPGAGRPPAGRHYACNLTKPELYLVRVGADRAARGAGGQAAGGSAAGLGRLRELLRREFNRSVELQLTRTASGLAFRAVSGPSVYTAISVLNALRRARGPLPAVSALHAAPDVRYRVHTVLLFVPAHVDVRVCDFSERVESGLLAAYGQSRRRSSEAGAVGVQLLNVTLGGARPAAAQKLPVDIVFAVRDGRGGYLPGFEVSRHLRKLSLVEFSFYVGFPALQIAEPFHYPELNTSHHLRFTWVRTVLLGVPSQMFSERSLKARLERRLASLLEEGLAASGGGRRRRATAAADGSLQVVRVARLAGPERPLEVLYFAEGPGGKRLPAEVTAQTLNSLDLQRAAIVLGHQVRRPLAQPVEAASVPPAETQGGSVWLIVGVIVPVFLALFIVVLLYWKLCGSEKLEFQPDAVNAVQQRQKVPNPPGPTPPPPPTRLLVSQLQASSVKGFDFAKLHLGQRGKDHVEVIQEAGPAPAKEAPPSDGGDLNTPKSKGSSTGAARRHGRPSRSEADSLGSDRSSGRESAEESAPPAAAPVEAKRQRKLPKNAPSGADELMTPSSIFDHVDRLSRGSSDGARRPAGKVQLVAMQPRPGPSLSREVGAEVELRHKSEMELRGNKVRQRAKRRGQCEFPSMDDIMDAFGDGPVQTEAARRLYGSGRDRRAHYVPPADASSPPTPADQRRRGRSSPGGRGTAAGPGSLPDTDQDRLLVDHGATYRKYPGLQNVAYTSDPDLAAEPRSPSPADEVFDGEAAAAPPPYVPPQPSIEEARRQMRCLLDDAFALVSPSSRGLSPALPGRRWGSYPAGPFSAVSPPPRRSPSPPCASLAFLLSPQRYAELALAPGHAQRQSSGGGVSSGKELQDPLYSSGGQYKHLPSSSRPRPVGGSTAGVQLQHLTQVGLSSHMGAFPGVGRSASGPGGSSWSERRSDQDASSPAAGGESAPSFPEFSSSPLFQLPSSLPRDPSAPPLLLASPTPDYPPADASPSARSSASLIKAIREELCLLAQKQALSGYP